jgi:hypothetical protein
VFWIREYCGYARPFSFLSLFYLDGGREDLGWAAAVALSGCLMSGWLEGQIKKYIKPWRQHGRSSAVVVGYVVELHVGEATYLGPGIWLLARAWWEHFGFIN